MNFEDASWWQAYREELNSDERWSEAARYFPARIELRHEHGSATLDVRDGRVVGLVDGPHPLGADVVVSAPNREWSRIVEGKTDWFQGNSPGLGEISLEGNVAARCGT